jgi:hypothetical protein
MTSNYQQNEMKISKYEYLKRYIKILKHRYLKTKFYIVMFINVDILYRNYKCIYL